MALSLVERGGCKQECMAPQYDSWFGEANLCPLSLLLGLTIHPGDSFYYGWGEVKIQPLHQKNLVFTIRTFVRREGARQMFIYHHQSFTVFHSTYN